MNHNRDIPQRGFTLIEILLALVILGIILTTVYGALSRTLFSKNVAEERSELFANGRDAVLKMASEIEAAMPPPSGDRIYFRGTGGLGQIPSLEFVAMNRGSYGVNPLHPGRVLIAYTLDPLPERRDLFALRREEHSFAALLAEADGIAPPSFGEEAEDTAPTAIATYLLDCPDTPEAIELPGSCARVVGLSFRYFDDALNDWRDEWDSTADGPMYRRLPAAVEIGLFLADERGAAHDFTTIVDLPLARGQPTPGPEGLAGAEDDDEEHDASDEIGASQPQRGTQRTSGQGSQRRGQPKGRRLR